MFRRRSQDKNREKIGTFSDWVNPGNGVALGSRSDPYSETNNKAINIVCKKKRKNKTRWASVRE